ncbi:MAG: HigA family addiction module antitoxin [Methyloceanibacter sp.]
MILAHRIQVRRRQCLRCRPCRLPLGELNMPMKTPPHPGLSVRHDCLEPLGLSVTDAARRLGVSRKQLSDVLNGHSGISPEMAIRLDKAFGGGADTWFRLQAAYDLAQAMKKASTIKVQRIIRAA